MDIVSRLKRYMEHINMPSSQFADTAQIPRPTMSQILNGRNKKISNELIAKLHEAFPTLSIMWLMFGDGDMETGENIGFSEPQNGQNSLFSEAEIAGVKGVTEPRPSTKTVENRAQSGKKTSNSPIHTLSLTSEAQISSNSDSAKQVSQILVFYTDNSYETFVPKRQQ